MKVDSVCRLCMSEKELCCVFDDGINGGSDVKTIIFITTGVEILQNDIVSQKICSNCFKLTGKMFEFRERAVKTDKYLKDQYKSQEITDTQINNVISIKSKGDTEIVPPVNNEDEIGSKAATITNEIKPSKVTPEKSKPADVPPTNPSSGISKKAKKRVHKSIEDIFIAHSEIKLPSSCLRLDVNPSVTLEMDYVEQYFLRNKLDMKKYVQRALRSNRASKKTTQIKEKKPITAKKSGIEDNRRNVEGNEPGSLKVSSISIQLPKIQSPNKPAGDNDDSDHSTVKPSKSVKRRRISDSFSEPEPIQPPTLMETLQLKPNENVHRCTICNYPHRSVKSLKQHYRTHFKCTFCKKRFKLLDRKQTHDNKCEIKFCLTRQVYVKLEKIDIAGYEVPKTDAIEKTVTRTPVDIESIEKADAIENEVPKTPVEKTDAIEKTATRTPVEIEKTVTKTPVEVESIEKTDAIATKTRNNDVIELSDDDTAPHKPAPPVAACASKSAKLPATVRPLHNDVPKLVNIAPSPSFVEQPQCTSTSIVKPSIHIKDNGVLNAIDTSGPDVKVLKQLLSTTSLNNLKLLIDDGTQTSPPSNDQIQYNNHVAEFKNLFSQLHSYSIPITVQNGDFKVSYDKNPKRTSHNKSSLAHWGHTKPVDIKGAKQGLFNIENFNNHISQGIPLFRKSKDNSSRATILNHTLISPMLPQLVATNSAPRTYTPQPGQTRKYTIDHHPTQTSHKSLPQRVQTQTNNIPVHVSHQQAQSSQLSDFQARNVPQPVQTQNNNILMRRILSGNNLARSLPPQVQNQTRNKPTNNFTAQIQNKIQSLTEIPNINVLPQTLQFQIQNVPQQKSINTIPVSSSTLNQNLQNVQQTPVYTADVQALHNYFLPSNNNNNIFPVNSTSLNSTVTSNVQGSVNTNANTLSRGRIQSQSINVLRTNPNSAILNPSVSITHGTLISAAPSTSSQLVINNPQSSISNFVVNTSYSSSVSNAPLLNATSFTKTTDNTMSAINAVPNSSYPSSVINAPLLNVNSISKNTASTMSGVNVVPNTAYPSSVINAPLLNVNTVSRNTASTMPGINTVPNTSYPSSVINAPLLNVNSVSTMPGINTAPNASTESQRNCTTNNVESSTDVQRPKIRVRNLFELT